jgi:hypothetical protein
MKKLYLFLAIILSFSHIFSGSVSESDALLVAKTQFKLVAHLPSINDVDGQLAYSMDYHKADNSLVKAFYVFNMNNESGFVIVAGDDKITPIIAYSDEGAFNGNDLPEGVNKLMMMYRNQIANIANDVNILAHPSITSKWDAYINDRVVISSSRSTNVGPLTTTKWSQSPYYNKDCPGVDAPTGCVQTAITQVMKYWNHPVQGKGNYSFNHNVYGTLSANFGSTTYDWANMPIKLNSSSDTTEVNAVAKLMYHVGVAMDADYSEDGTGAYTQRCKIILPQFFGYKTGIKTVARSWHSATSWKGKMQTELDAGRVIVHEGFCPDPSAGHAFVVDGYDTTGKFHFNWGWSGSYNGFFETDSLSPGGTYTWNQGQKIFTHIEPLPSVADIKLASNVVVNPAIINFNDTFNVAVSIANFGTSVYNGSYRVSLFDENDNNVGNVDTVFTQSINVGDSIHLNFPSSGLAITPGVYKLGVYGDEANTGQWKLIDEHNYTNPIDITITATNNLGLVANNNIIVNPNPMKQYDSVNVNFEILNSDVVTFNGTISIDLHNLNGDWVKEISSASANILSGASQSFSFHKDSIEDMPGSYQLVIWHKPTGSSNWEIIEEGTYPNSIDVDIVGLSFTGDLADQYESNDTIINSYNLPLTYTNDYAKISTVGANIHVRDDKDYYKVHLDPNYTYLVYGRMYDNYNDGGYGPFTNDMMFNYYFRTDEGAYYDDQEMPSIVVNNVNPLGEDFYFEILSFYPDLINNNIGTYKFEIEVIRQGATTGIEENVNPEVVIYPNPASQSLNILHEGYTSIAIVNIAGKVIKSFKTTDVTSSVDVSDISQGSYFVRLQGENNTVVKKIEVVK